MDDPAAEWRRIAATLAEYSIEAGVFREPIFDQVTHQLVERSPIAGVSYRSITPLRVDLLNVYHVTHQLKRPGHDAALRAWATPSHLGEAAYYGRIDVVRRRVAEGAVLDGEDFGGNPIAAAVGAWVVTPLHLECVTHLFEAGAKATLNQLAEWEMESAGSETDLDMLEVLARYGRRSPDSKVRTKAEAIDIDVTRAAFAAMRARARRDGSGDGS